MRLVRRLPPNRRGDGNVVADFPFETFGGNAADNCAVACFQPRLFLSRGEQKFREHVEKLLWLDRNGGKEILWILIDAAKP
jgi:hypothetical protein